MRFHIDGPSIPDRLLERCDAGEVVFLCGAGVSCGSGMPDFLSLTKHVIDSFDPPADSKIMKAFNPWLDDVPDADASVTNAPLDQIFTLLYQEYGRNQVNAIVTDQLFVSPFKDGVGNEHKLIKRISSSRSGKPQVVTTNFDLLFQHGESANEIPTYVPPALPDVAFGMSIEGITYLHGCLDSYTANQNPYVLSSSDFGRAYLSEAWATKFISGLLSHYTVVLVGYSAEDPPMKYLLQGLKRDGAFDQTRLFAFDKGEPMNVKVKWQDKGVTSIAYREHDDLWQTMKAWADRSDDPRMWRRKVVEAAKRGPREMLSHQRGQVVHTLRSVSGAKLFAEVRQSPDPEWICVLDASIRGAKRCGGFGDHEETFDPSCAYGLDDDKDSKNTESIANQDDLREIRLDHLLNWRDGDYNPPESHTIGGRQVEGSEVIPARLNYLVWWIANSCLSPVIAWWAARQRGLHPGLIDLIDSHLRHESGIDEQCRNIWNLILEHHRDSRNRRRLDTSWYNLKRRIKHEKWTPGVLREFRRACQPRISIESPIGLHENKPPVSSWSALSLPQDIGQFEVKYLDYHNEVIDVPTDVLPTVFGFLESQLLTAIRILLDLQTPFIHTPTCYPDRESDGGNDYHDSTDPLLLFVRFFDQLVEHDSALAKNHALHWDVSEKFFFRKLKLYALSKTDLYEASEVVGIIASFDQDVIWDSEVAREFLFLLVDRWSQFSVEHKEILAGHIFYDMDSCDDSFDLAHNGPSLHQVVAYARYLQMKGCDLPETLSTKIDEIISGLAEWKDRWATSILIKRGVRVSRIRADETPNDLLGLKPSEIVSRAQADFRRDFGSFTEKRSFDGLVKSHPRKALLALIVEVRKRNFPSFAWSALIREPPKKTLPRVYRVFLTRLARLPYTLIVELRHAIGAWVMTHLSDALEFDIDLGWRVYDHFVNGIISGESETSENNFGHASQSGKIVRNDTRTYRHAINAPIGMCVEALLFAAPAETLVAESLIPTHIRMRMEQLLRVRGASYGHAVSVLMRNLNWVMYVDPQWTKERLTPIFAFDHAASESAWNGFLHSRNYPSLQVALAIRPQLLKLFPWIYKFDWSDDLSEIAVSFLASLCVFHSTESGGLKDNEMRCIIREMKDRARGQLILWLNRVGKDHKDGWSKFVIPFISNVWPRERAFCTNESVSRWITLLRRTRDDFPAVYKAVKRFLIPVEIDPFSFSWLIDKDEGEEATATLYPKATLDLMNTLTPQVLSHPPDSLPKVLRLIEKSAPELEHDSRYLRLIDLVEST